ncbi:hypothetical protein PsorP6_012434 [Peronosclerospora sorghi]|uniref:Uncharacterized protein n=1 Tax=Peronosclerospora sorghi TaxID=230839 RepID=A0ACC0WI24_9STRA|nr:hypothetical protein PsorP6_012434 [Peronosclerospora sorghi]
MQLLVAFVATVALFGPHALVSGKTVRDPNDKGEPLFPDGHPNITYLTDANWDEHMAKTDKPWLVDFYHPFCPFCKQFVPSFIELAAYYKELGTLHVGALSCMDHVKCRRVSITGFPTLMTLNFDKKRPKKENKRIVGSHTVQEVKDYVNNLIAEVAFNETGSWPPGYTPPVKAKNKTEETNATKEMETSATTPAPAIWEETNLPMNQTTRLQDAASAFVFGLKQGVFMGSDVMDDEALDALKGWLKMVSQTFPGVINRKVITSLYEKVKDKELLDFDTWDAMLRAWQESTVAAFKAEEDQLDFTGIDVPEWQRLNDLFLGEGATYRACALYTCGQWTMFHMLTLNPPETEPRSSELMVSVAASIRRFVKHFFGCVDCRNHFLQESTVQTVKMIQDAEDKPMELRRWLWKQHNSVNKRIHHPIWPKPEVCPTCGTEAAWEMVEVDKWLSKTYTYRDTEAPAKVVVASAPSVESPALRVEDEKETEETKAVVEESAAPNVFAANEANGPIAVEPKGGDEYRPKDAELGIKNAANTLELVSNSKVKATDGLQGTVAPSVTVFLWYLLPLAAVGAYLVYVRSRATKQKAYRLVPRS